MASMRHSEEILQAIFSMREEGPGPFPPEKVLARARVGQDALKEALASGLVVEKDGRLELSEQGEAAAAVVVRRHRLAERLLHDVLSVRGEASESAACEIEHVLEAEVTESICTLLGHPHVCPHGKPIPPGACCEAGRRIAEPVVEPLSRLRSGESASVAYVQSSNPGRLERLASFGLLPGTPLRVKQTWPSTVVAMGETELAFDRETAEDIYVRRAPRKDEGLAPRGGPPESVGGRWRHRFGRRGE